MNVSFVFFLLLFSVCGFACLFYVCLSVPAWGGGEVKCMIEVDGTLAPPYPFSWAAFDWGEGRVYCI